MRILITREYFSCRGARPRHDRPVMENHHCYVLRNGPLFEINQPQLGYLYVAPTPLPLKRYDVITRSRRYSAHLAGIGVLS